jgi:hypothetical protein
MEVKGYPNYLIYLNGKVWSKKSKIYLSPRLHKGYLQVDLWKDGNKKTHSIHRLLAIHFIENPHNYTEVDHWDQNRKNNKLNNLRWVTRSENQQNTLVRKNNKLGIKNISYVKRDNLYQYKKTINGERHRQYFKTLEETIEYKKNYEKNI